MNKLHSVVTKEEVKISHGLARHGSQPSNDCLPRGVQCSFPTVEFLRAFISE